MNPLDYAKFLAEFWTAQGMALMKTQEQAGKAIADVMQAMAGGAFPALPTMHADLAPGFAELSRAGQSLTELWSAATSMASTLAAATSASGGGDAAVQETYRKMVDPQTWLGGMGEMDQALSRMAEGPRLADLWDAERRQARILQAWMAVRRRALEQNAVQLEAWQRASRRFTESLAARTSADGHAPDAKAALALWTDIANRELLETQRSEPFLQTQAAMIRASTELQLAQQDLVEHFARQYGFPTRTELDDVHRTVTELRREIRLMRREQRLQAPPLAAPPTATRKAPPPRPPTQRKGKR